MRTFPSWYAPADEAAHARAGSQVNRHAMLFQPLNDADVRDPFGTASTECHAYAGP